MNSAPPEPNERSSGAQIATACAMIAAGGLLMGLQRRADGALAGTGFASLGMGAVIALLPTVTALSGASRGSGGPILPRDWLSALSGLCGFAGLAFVASGVLVPGGPWMFIEALLLLLVLSRRNRDGEVAGLQITSGTLLWLAVLWLARLWVTYRGVTNEWAALRFEVPLLGSLPWLPEWMRVISLGDFTAEEFGIPAVGLHFAQTITFWAVGMALCVGGLWWRHRAAIEYENDKVHGSVQRLPPALTAVVNLLLPEDEWRELGLHGLSERQRCKRVVQLTQERVVRQAELNRVLAGGLPLLSSDAPPFAHELQRLFSDVRMPALPASGSNEESNSGDAAEGS